MAGVAIDSADAVAGYLMGSSGSLPKSKGGRWPAQVDPLRRPDRRGDVDRIDPDVTRGLVGQQGHELLGEPTELWRGSLLVAQGGELVPDQWVVDDLQAHGVHRSAGDCWWPSLPWSVTIRVNC